MKLKNELLVERLPPKKEYHRETREKTHEKDEGYIADIRKES